MYVVCDITFITVRVTVLFSGRGGIKHDTGWEMREIKGPVDLETEKQRDQGDQ